MFGVCVECALLWVVLDRSSVRGLRPLLPSRSPVGDLRSYSRTLATRTSHARPIYNLWAPRRIDGDGGGSSETRERSRPRRRRADQSRRHCLRSARLLEVWIKVSYPLDMSRLIAAFRDSRHFDARRASPSDVECDSRSLKLHQRATSYRRLRQSE